MLGPINLDRSRRLECLGLVFDQFELIAEGVKHVIDASRRAGALVEDNGTVHDSAAAIGEEGFGGFEVINLESDVMSSRVAIAARLAIPISGPVIIETVQA
jgi:hypothetical protein